MDSAAQWDELQGSLRPENSCATGNEQEARGRAEVTKRAYYTSRRERLLLKDAGLYYRALLEQWQGEWARMFKSEANFKAGSPLLYELLKQGRIRWQDMGNQPQNWKFK